MKCNLKKLDQSEKILNNQKLKAYVINKLRKLEMEQKSFFASISKERKLDDFLTVNEVMKEYSTSRKTIYRWREKGLKVYQKTPSANLRIKRVDLINFLKETSYAR